MRHVLALVLLVALASTAGATVHNVTNDATLTTAMGAGGAQAGDIVNIAAGSYTVKPVPANSGTAGNPIRLVGSQANPGSVAFSVGIDWTAGTTRSYISWTGLKLGDDVTFYRADHCSLTYCRVDSGGFISFGSNSDPGSLGISTNNYIGYSTFRQNIASASFATVFKRTHQTTIERCRFYQTITNAAVDARGRYLYQSANNTFRNNALFVECWGASNGEQFVQGIRDTSANNTFDTDTIWVGLTSRRSRRTLLSQSGTYVGTANGNVWTGCDYRSFDPSDNDFGFEFQDNVYGTVQNCVFASRMRTALQVFHNTSPGLSFRHVTAYSGGAQALNYPDTTVASQNFFGGCAFATRVASACTDNYSSLFRIDTPGAWGTRDSCSFITPDTSGIFMKSSGTRTCYALSGWVGVSGDDAHSVSVVLSGTAFVDTTWATLDLRPASSSSPLKSAIAPGGYYGAFDVAAAGGGATPTPFDSRPWDDDTYFCIRERGWR